MKTFLLLILSIFFLAEAHAQDDTTKVSPSPTKATFAPITDIPEPKKGMGELNRFIKKNLIIPQAARENGARGRVLVSFIVEKDGSLSDFRVVKGLGYGCDEEAIRVLKLAPKWKPGLQNGKPVRVNYIFPLIVDY